MLKDTSLQHASCDYIGQERRSMIAEEIEKIDPFCKTREPVKFYEKSRGSPFSGFTNDKIDRFVDRNKENFCRKFHDKLI